MAAEVHAPVFEMALDSHHPAQHEAELTPIFHALARSAADPVEHFRRDPLGAPLPSVTSSAPAMTRMLLRAVPASGGERGGRHRALP